MSLALQRSLLQLLVLGRLVVILPAQEPAGGIRSEIPPAENIAAGVNNTAGAPATMRLAWELGPTGSPASLRGLSAATDEVIWASGSDGTVLRSSDGGASWMECGPTLYPELEFRAIHAWNAETACVASAGTPALILRTANGGVDWQVVYRHASAQAFFDGLRFWDAKRGMAFSDPVDGRLLVVETTDGGLSWQEAESTHIPLALEGEAGFAASNSSLVLGRDGQAWIGTGGAKQESSRVYYRASWNAKWMTQDCPLPSGPSEGVFSLVVGSQGKLVAVGGDYRPDIQSRRTAASSVDGGHTWRVADPGPGGYRSAVVQLPIAFGEQQIFIATGPGGSDASIGGDQWQPFSENGFHVLTTSSSQVFAAGADGRFAKLKSSLHPGDQLINDAVEKLIQVIPESR